MGGFRRFSTIFSAIFWKISTIFWKISAIFWKISTKFFAIFFDFCDFSENFSENSHPQSVTVQPGSRHYCKFTSKFTPKFTPILIKILQSTKFEGSHFYNSIATFSTPFNSLRPSKTTENFSPRCRVFSTMAPPFQRPKRPSLPLRRRRYVGNTRDYK